MSAYIIIVRYISDTAVDIGDMQLTSHLF